MEIKAIEERILSSAEELFFSFGYTKTTTEDIAREASVSKRTLYKYFKSKTHILEVMVNKLTNILATELNKIIQSDASFPEKMHDALIVERQILSKVSKHFIEDIQRNVPEIWQELSEFRKDMVNTIFANLLEEGINTGYVNKNINRGIVVLIMISVTDVIINTSIEKTLPSNLSTLIPHGIDNIFEEIIHIIYNGILNEPIVYNKP